MATASGYNNSAVATATYTINIPTAATPTFSPAAGTYTAAQTVTISDATTGATIYYTTDGSTPTTSSTKYAGAVTVSATETINAIAAASGYNNSAVATAAYTINLPTAATPIFSLAAGTYTGAQTLTISDPTAGSTIYYTTDGSTPTASSTKYAGAITVSATETLNAIATASGYTNSTVATAAYTINIPVAATPTFSQVAGTYTGAQTVGISDATIGATIYYTTDGSTPAASSTKYAGAITVSATETLNAIAVATGYTNSTVATAAYTINPPPLGVNTATVFSYTANPPVLYAVMSGVRAPGSDGLLAFMELPLPANGVGNLQQFVASIPQGTISSYSRNVYALDTAPPGGGSEAFLSYNETTAVSSPGTASAVYTLNYTPPITASLPFTAGSVVSIGNSGPGIVAVAANYPAQYSSINPDGSLGPFAALAGTPASTDPSGLNIGDAGKAFLVQYGVSNNSSLYNPNGELVGTVTPGGSVANSTAPAPFGGPIAAAVDLTFTPGPNSLANETDVFYPVAANGGVSLVCLDIQPGASGESPTVASLTLPGPGGASFNSVYSVITDIAPAVPYTVLVVGTVGSSDAVELVQYTQSGPGGAFAETGHSTLTGVTGTTPQTAINVTPGPYDIAVAQDGGTNIVLVPRVLGGNSSLGPSQVGPTLIVPIAGAVSPGANLNIIVVQTGAGQGSSSGSGYTVMTTDGGAIGGGAGSGTVAPDGGPGASENP
jgi:hypothetical protein